MDKRPAGTMTGPRLALIRRREQLGLNRSQLARKVRVSRSTLVTWEDGTHSPAGNLAPLAEALEVTFRGLHEMLWGTRDG